MSIELKTRVNRVVYYNQQSGWGVLSVLNNLSTEDKVKHDFTGDYITLAGLFSGVYPNCIVEVVGEEKTHPTYGKQLQITSLSVVQDTSSKESIINFLTKSAIKGIQVQNAVKIYNEYKDESIDIVLNQTHLIKNIRGIGEKTYQKVLDSVDNYKRMEDLIKYGTEKGIPYSIIYKLDKELKEKALDILKTDPYSILTKVQGIPFERIDEIALKSGISPTDEKRLKCGFKYFLINSLNLESSTGIKFPQFIKVFKKALGITSDQYFFSSMNLLESEGEIIVDSNTIYYKTYYDTEKYISEVIKTMLSCDEMCKPVGNEAIIEKHINSFSFELNEQQKETIYNCCKNRFNIITGPAGSGKSSITKALVNIFEETNHTVILLSPTGKATRRMTECTAHEASTIHKFLKVKTSLEDAQKIDIDENSVIIVDESSMMDIVLFSKLLDCIKNSTRIILVGDNDQLPSVQAGNVLGDLVRALPENTSFLTDVMRQAENSTIIKYCSYINNGKTISECNVSDFYYKEFTSQSTLRDYLAEYYRKEVSDNGLMEVQVLTPYKKGILGANSLNKDLSELVNINTIDENSGYRLGDKVIQLVNNYKYNVFNGETGLISYIGDDSIVVEYENSSVEYPEEEYDQFTLANVITVHKSQGSEYKTIFVVLDGESDFLMIRKILYTAVSRGKTKVYLFGMKNYVTECINNSFYKERITCLCDFMQEGKVCLQS